MATHADDEIDSDRLLDVGIVTLKYTLSTHKTNFTITYWDLFCFHRSF